MTTRLPASFAPAWVEPDQGFATGRPSQDGGHDKVRSGVTAGCASGSAMETARKWELDLGRAWPLREAEHSDADRAAPDEFVHHAGLLSHAGQAGCPASKIRWRNAGTIPVTPKIQPTCSIRQTQQLFARILGPTRHGPRIDRGIVPNHRLCRAPHVNPYSIGRTLRPVARTGWLELSQMLAVRPRPQTNRAHRPSVLPRGGRRGA